MATAREEYLAGALQGARDEIKLVIGNLMDVYESPAFNRDARNEAYRNAGKLHRLVGDITGALRSSGMEEGR